MPIVRVCIAPHCHETTTQGSRCIKHRREYEAAVLQARPWEGLYDSAEWQKVRKMVKNRDGHRCAYKAGGRRCANNDIDGFLHVHHTFKAQDFWRQHGSPKIGSDGWRDFIQDATDPHNLVTLCTRHHHPAEQSISGDQVRRLDLSTNRSAARHGSRRQEQYTKKRLHKRDERKDWT